MHLRVSTLAWESKDIKDEKRSPRLGRSRLHNKEFSDQEDQAYRAKMF